MYYAVNIVRHYSLNKKMINKMKAKQSNQTKNSKNMMQVAQNMDFHVIFVMVKNATLHNLQQIFHK